MRTGCSKSFGTCSPIRLSSLPAAAGSPLIWRKRRRTLKFGSPIPASESKPIFFLMCLKGSGRPTPLARARTEVWASAWPSSGTLWSPTAEPSARKAPATSRVRHLSRAFPCGPSRARQKHPLRFELQHDPDLGGNAVEPPFANGGSREAAKDIRHCRNQPDSAGLAILRDLNVDHHFAGQLLVQKFRGVIRRYELLNLRLSFGVGHQTVVHVKFSALRIALPVGFSDRRCRT